MQQTTDRLCDLSETVVLIGSMLSSDASSILPAGQTVSTALVENIVQPVFKNAPADLGVTRGDILRIERLARNTPFEVLLQDHPEPEYVRATLADLYRQGRPNPLHHALAKAVDAGNVSHIITTNYDTCIESALSSSSLPQVILDEAKASNADFSDARARPIVFKIHGCVTDERTMVFRLLEEGALPCWKRSLLAKIVDGRDVVVIGYSGLDFDICPVLFQLKYRRLIWLFADNIELEGAIENSSPNLRSIHSAHHTFDRVFGRLGGFDAMFEGLPDASGYQFRPSRQPADVASRLFLRENNDQFAYNIWRGRLLHTISCRLGSEAVCQAMLPSDRNRPEALRLWSDTLERAGRYTDSIGALKNLEGYLETTLNYESLLEVSFTLAGRWHTAMRPFAFRTAWARYRSRVRWCTEHRVQFDEALAQARDVYLQVLALKQIIVFVPCIGGTLARRWARRIHPSTFERAAQLHYERGEWQEVRLIRTACHDVGIEIEVRGASETAQEADFLLGTVDAFSHANNIVGQASAYRREKIKDASRCEELLEALVAFGHTAEFWKSYFSFLAHLSKRRRLMYRGFALSELMQCQYSLLVKTLQIFRALAKMLFIEATRVVDRRK
jgi:hypothetical protein